MPEKKPSRKALAHSLREAFLSVRQDSGSKDAIRHAHRRQRQNRIQLERPWLESRGWAALAGLAESDEISPKHIRPRLVPVTTEGRNADLFRLAALLWTVPVSRGYGRRMRYLVIDETNDKLMGIFALGDPVFNLRVRDRWIGWNVQERRERISSVMDMYVCGAVPPYNQLLVGKLIASLATSQEVVEQFRQRYVGREGIISKRQKPTDLLLITTTSALGRSSVYNRINLGVSPSVRFQNLGMTEGWGHFAIDDELFLRLRDFLADVGHKYADGHRFGTGPNWRLRTIRAAMDLLGVDGDLLKHGIQREVFACEMSSTTREQLTRGLTDDYPCRLDSVAIATKALERWVFPRSERQELQQWTREDAKLAILSDLE